MPTFVNYDREHMAAVAGFAKAIPPHGAGYSFENSGAMETRSNLNPSPNLNPTPYSLPNLNPNPNQARWRRASAT